MRRSQVAIQVNHPERKENVVKRLGQWQKENPQFRLVGIVANIEFNVRAATLAARELGLHQATVVNTDFQVPAKDEAVAMVGQRIVTVKSSADLGRLRGPWVIKNPFSGGSRGVLIARTREEADRTIAAINEMVPHAGADAVRVSAERMYRGKQYSMQCVVRDGRVSVLTFSENLVTIGPPEGIENSGLRSPVERGHLLECGAQIPGVRGSGVPVALLTKAQQTVEAVRYTDGPLQIDLLQEHRSRGAGPVHLVDVGYRLSGNELPDDVQFVSGRTWGVEALAALLGAEVPPGYEFTPTGPRPAVAHYALPRDLAERIRPELVAAGWRVGEPSMRPSETERWKELMGEREAPKLMVAINQHWGETVVVRKAGDRAQLWNELIELHARLLASSPDITTPTQFLESAGALGPAAEERMAARDAS